MIDTHSITEALAFDHLAIASILSEVLGKTINSQQLPIDTLAFCSKGGIQLTLKKNSASITAIEIDQKCKSYQCEYDPAEKLTTAPQSDKNDLLPIPSPDGRYQILYQNHNLILHDCASGKETALTEDGEPHYGYGTCADHMSVGICGKKKPPLTVM